jgi:hypothetical protein
MSDGLWCWWCCHTFDSPEKHYPYKYDEKRRHFTTYGRFCSWACVKSYSIDQGGSREGERQMYMALMRKHEYGRSVSCFPAPKRQALKVFGGSLSIEEFRAFGGVKEGPAVIMPNETHMLHRVGAPVAVVINDIEGIDPAGLKLKRDKPLARTKSKLESALGITRKLK